MQNQNSYYSKSQNIDNARKVKQFYLEVLKQFSQRLERQMRYKQRFIRSDQIQQLEKRVKYKLEYPPTLFDHFMSMKEGAAKVEYQMKNEQVVTQNNNGQVKEEYDEANNDYRITSDKLLSIYVKMKRIKIHSQKEMTQKGEGQSLQVIAFRPVKSEVEVKKQQSFDTYKQKILVSEKEIKQQENESDNSDNQLTIQQCQKSLNTIILSTFNTSTLKHKPKQQKITINLDNTFVKSVYNQFYVGQVQVDINKIEKTEVKKEYPYNELSERRRSNRS